MFFSNYILADIEERDGPEVIVFGVRSRKLSNLHKDRLFDW
jgi:hypothetical protein